MRILVAMLAVLLLLAAMPSFAQDGEVSLGDVARATRKQKPAEDERPVIDNDNLTTMMDKAESERIDGKPVFSIDPSGKTFRMTSPDGTCSLSFDARAAALISTPYMSSDLPAYELARLEGTAAIHDGFLEITLHNGTEWELKEIAVGVTVLNPRGAELEPAGLLSTVAAQVESRSPDATEIFHLKATSGAGATTVYRVVVGEELGQTRDWHWALVAARGLPPTPAVPAATASIPTLASGVVQQQAVGDLPGAQSTVAGHSEVISPSGPRQISPPKAARWR
jgi:hypothetical protein